MIDPLDERLFSNAACRGADPGLFIPDRTAPKGVNERRIYAAALAFCAECPVTAECLEVAERDKEPGVRGGLTPNERDLRRGYRIRHRATYLADHGAGDYKPYAAVETAHTGPALPSVSAYQKGCRCEECRRLHAEARRRYRRASKEKIRDHDGSAHVFPGRPPSASNYSYGCRCLECRAARRVQKQEQARRAAERMTPWD